MGQRDSRIRMLQDVILPRVDSSTFPDSVRHVTVLVKYKYALPYLSLFLVSRFLSMPSMRFLNQVAMLACLAAGCPCMICREDSVEKF